MRRDAVRHLPPKLSEFLVMAPRSNMFCFKFENHGDTVLHKMNLLREQNRFCDVTLQIKNFEFHGHKVVLAASSPFLRDQFLLNDSREVTISVLQSSEISRQLLLSCYTGILEFPMKDLVNYLTAASALQMGHVVEKCTQAVSQYLDPTLAHLQLQKTHKSSFTDEGEQSSPSIDDTFQGPEDIGIYIDSNDGKNVKSKCLSEFCFERKYQAFDSSSETTSSHGMNTLVDEVDQEVISGDIYMLAAHEIEFQGLVSTKYSPEEEDRMGQEDVRSPLISKLMTDNHIREYDTILQKPYYCKMCCRMFQHLENYISHMKEHKLYLCLRCGKTFSQKSNLTRHIRVHTGFKPFECSLCKKAFSQKATLQDHINLHTGKKPHKCNYCAVNFAHKPGLRRHLKDIHGKSSLENTSEEVGTVIVDSD
ncbi:zinc finger and BTB domain-containing protein 26-like isoform X1 [Polypterus senegalus]|uniref:zinc finger and BTB domain-containing protein 26-like isoform X1 n=2 Tax=Polypterus senegalus TaxID=55291 RepID=UPI001963D25D|nr:zinc finger and BTB domain-containing protein 26-like isoform X1 [Polypterus senegalus]